MHLTKCGYGMIIHAFFTFWWGCLLNCSLFLYYLYVQILWSQSMDLCRIQLSDKLCRVALPLCFPLQPKFVEQIFGQGLGSSTTVISDQGLGSNTTVISGQGLGSNTTVISGPGLGSNTTVISGQGLSSNTTVVSIEGLGRSTRVISGQGLGSNTTVVSIEGPGRITILNVLAELHSLGNLPLK